MSSHFFPKWRFVAFTDIFSNSNISVQFSSVAQSCRTLCNPMDYSTPVFLFITTPGACSNSCPWSQWCHPIISSSIVPFSSLQFFPASGSFPMSQFFASGGQNFSFSISPSNEYLGLISFRMDWLDLLVVQETLKSLSNTTVQKHQFFSAQLSL